MGKYFTINELCVSGSYPKLVTVPKAGTTEYKNLERLIGVLDQIREKWGSAIIVTSGFRNPTLNARLNGSKTSAHLKALAADIHPKTGSIMDLAVQIAESDLEYDQLILEKVTTKNGKITDCQWLHFGLTDGKPRKQILAWDGKKYTPAKLQITKEFSLT